MFAVKSMDVNFNLLKLKLDMVYRDLSAEKAQERFSELSNENVEEPTPAEKPVIPEKPKAKPATIVKSRRKTIKVKETSSK
jgi:hypothetical protein